MKRLTAVNGRTTGPWGVRCMQWLAHARRCDDSRGTLRERRQLHAHGVFVRQNSRCLQEAPPTGADGEKNGRETEAGSGETAVTLSRADLSSLVESAVQRALASRPQPPSTVGGELSVSQASLALHTFPPPGWQVTAPFTPGSHAWEYRLSPAPAPGSRTAAHSRGGFRAVHALPPPPYE